MEEFLGPARLLLAALGFTALQPIAARAGTDGAGPSGPLADILLHFSLPKRGVEATGHSTDEGLVVLAGAKGASTVRSSISKGYREQRKKLIGDGSIKDNGTQIEFKRDVLFNSPSAAACVLVGGSWNGRTGWKDRDGKTLAALEDALLDAASPDTK